MIDHVPPATAEMIERAIDANGLGEVLLAIGGILRGKAEHVVHAWQGSDDAGNAELAKRILRMAGHIDRVACLRECEGL